MYFVAYVEDLERRAACAMKNMGGIQAPQQHLSPAVDHTEVTAVNQVMTTDQVIPADQVTVIGQDAVADQATAAMTSPFDSQPAMSSSHEFGSRIKKLPADSKSPILLYPKPIPPDQVDDAYKLEHERAVSRRSRVSDIKWPNEDEAHALLHTVVSSIGSVQHLIDPRAFSDNLSTFYEQEQDADPVITLQHVEMLMVFALGDLLQGKLQGESSFPGAEYFLHAVSHLPSLCTLRKAGILAIETMGLFAFFLQCSDRKDDAYIYAGVALRLGIMNGLCRSAEGNALKRSEKTHRNRLWWTIYMQERRLAAATGNPVGVLDENITTDRPTDAAGFPAVAALDTNVKLARITGQTLQNVYSPNHRTSRQFIEAIENLVVELFKLDKEMPPQCKADLSTPSSLTRTGATLSLMFSQSMILATRPVLLHLAKVKREGSNLGIAFTESPVLRRLATYCIDAAGTSLDILHALKRQNLIARFGFFDLDAAISSAFVFVLVESTHSADSPQSGIQGIAAAMSILRFLGENGNKAAERRLKDVQHVCEHLGIMLGESGSLPGFRMEEAAAPTNLDHSGLATAPTSVLTNGQLGPSDHDLLDGAAGTATGFDWRQALVSLDVPDQQFNSAHAGDNAIWDGVEGFNFDFNSDFMLNEADVTAWEQFERQIVRNFK
ncbi:hypothetical protein J1614_002810 [Plenodomus biglobosus]|nr:hypothetical protein J1614_002810 [Plenodomus biglobosus]